jgi:hypothetical protein
MGRLTAALLGAPAVLAVTLLPLTIRTDLATVAAAGMTGAISLLGLLLPSPLAALSGAILAEIIIAIAVAVTPNSDGVAASFGAGAALLLVLVMTHARARAAGAPVGAEVLRADVGHTARALLAAGLGAGIVILVARQLAGPLAGLRPLLVVAGGLLAVGAVVQGAIAHARNAG